MLTITKEFQFDSAHLLDGHDGQCQYVHGHTYKLFVEITGDTDEDGPSEGMIIDFKELKKIVNDLVVKKLDHAFIYDLGNVNECEIAQFLEDRGMKVHAFEHRTTCELMAKTIFEVLNNIFDVVSITLYETPTSFSKYTGKK